LKRKCKELITANDGKRAIYIDLEAEAEIMAYIRKDNRHLKKFRFIADLVLGGHRNPDLYDKEDINDACKDVTAMKFFKGQENDRIYCKEVRSKNQVYVIIMAVLHLRKKSNSLSSKESAIINTIGGYNYEI
jgi:hypothetical protein